MTEEEMKALWDSVPADKAEELNQTATRIGAAVRALHDECLADPGKASELDEPWVLVDRLGIPRDNVPEATEQRLRDSFRRFTANGDTCSSCEILVLAVVLTFFAALLVMTALMAAMCAPPVGQALIAAGFVLATGAGLAIANAMEGQFAGAVGNPVCVTLGYCS